MPETLTRPPRVGDRVAVSFEGTVRKVDTDGRVLTIDATDGESRHPSMLVPSFAEVDVFAPVLPDVGSRITDPEVDSVVPHGAVFVDCDGRAWQKSRRGYIASGQYSRTFASLLAGFGPLTLVYVPAVKA